jgi:hypothetical protein
MHIDWSIIATITSPLLALILGAVLDRWLEQKPKLVTYYGHVSSFKLSGRKKTFVYTHSLIVRNSGRKAAHNVRLGHRVLPDFQIQPSIDHSLNVLPDGSKEILIPVLVPKEEIHLSYLYQPPTTYNQINIYVKSDEGFAKVLKVFQTPVYPNWMTNILKILVFIGATAAIYLIITLVIWVLKALG